MNIKTEFSKKISANQNMKHIKNITNFGLILSQLWKVVLISQIKQSNILCYQEKGERKSVLKICRESIDKIQNQFVISEHLS